MNPTFYTKPPTLTGMPPQLCLRFAANVLLQSETMSGEELKDPEILPEELDAQFSAPEPKRSALQSFGQAWTALCQHRHRRYQCLGT